METDYNTAFFLFLVKVWLLIVSPQPFMFNYLSLESVQFKKDLDV